MLLSRKFNLMAVTLGVAAFAAPVRAAEIDKLTPADAQAVVVFNIRQAINSPLAKKKGVSDILKAGIDGNPQAKMILAALSLDPTKDIESIAIAVGNLSDLSEGKKPENALITIRGNFNADKIDAAAKLADTIKIHKEGSITVYEIKDKGKDESGFATLIGNNIIAAAPSKEFLVKAVKNIGGGSKELVKAGAKVDGKQSMWVAMVFTEEMRKKMAENPQFKAIAPNLESFTAGINVTDDIMLDLNLNTMNDMAPKEIKKLIDQALPFITAVIGEDNPASPVVKDLMKGLKITANQDALNVNLKISEATLDKIMKLGGK